MRVRPRHGGASLGSLATARDGVSAIEFALVFPLIMLLTFGGYQLCQAVSAYRKTTLTARTVADLTTQYTSLGATDVSAILNASAQIMAPFDATKLTIILTHIQVSASGSATVIWSKALNGTPLVQGAATTVAANICQPGSSIVLAEVTYQFIPAVIYNRTGPIRLSSSVYMSPRSVQSIPYTGT